MPNALIKARQQLSQIRTFLRTGKPLPAVQALHAALVVVLKNPLMKAEKDEFTQLLRDAVEYINDDPKMNEYSPEHLSYTPGQERQLFDQVGGLLKVVDSDMRDSAQEALRLREARRQKLMEEGEAQLQINNLAKARSIFNSLAKENNDDSVILGQIGEMYLKYAAYEDAIKYLEIALRMNPELVHLYNRIGMALRKIGQFETAEKYYLKASTYLGRDPNLFFNLGRLYVDWKRWDKAIMAAGGALKLSPEFAEAQKLKEYAEQQFEKNRKAR